MATFGNIELPKMHNITELEAVSVKMDVKTEQREGQDGKPYTLNFIVVDDKEYRVPNSVIKQVQELMISEGLKTFRVISTGTGMQTKYSIKIIE